MRQQAKQLAAVLFLVACVIQALPAKAGGFMDSIVDKPLHELAGESFAPRTPLERTAAGAKLLAASPLSPVMGAVALTGIMAFGKNDCRLAPHEIALYGPSGAAVGTSLIPVAAIAGTVELSAGLSGLPFQAIGHFSELDKNGLPTHNGDKPQPTATLSTLKNGQVKTIEIPLEVNPHPIQLNQKLEMKPHAKNQPH